MKRESGLRKQRESEVKNSIDERKERRKKVWQDMEKECRVREQNEKSLKRKRNEKVGQKCGDRKCEFESGVTMWSEKLESGVRKLRDKYRDKVEWKWQK